jgi:hypothetical protein
MRSYADQRKAVEKLQGAAKLIDANKLNPRDRFMARTLPDVLDTINLAERLERVMREIYDAAKKNREFCLHCDSVAKIIEDFEK